MALQITACANVRIKPIIFFPMRARTHVMSGRSAAGVLLSIEERKREARGNPMTEKEKEAFRKKMIEKCGGKRTGHGGRL
jgi:3-methylcrotonyl-CoA carboxylase beta subunit